MTGELMLTRGIKLVSALLCAYTLSGCATVAGDEPSVVVVPNATAIAMAAPPEVAFDADECIHGPGSVPAGLTKISLNNMGKVQHQIQLVELPDGKSFRDVEDHLLAEEKGPAEWLSYAGGPNAVVPGQSSSAFVDLKPGNYVVICQLIDDQGNPHYKTGMALQLNVTEPSQVPVAAPASDLTITGREYAFGLSEGQRTMATGMRVVTFANDGQQPHEAALVRLDDGVTAADYIQAFKSGQEDAGLPGQRVGGLGAIDPGAQQAFAADLAPGHYALMCFVEDPTAKLAHAEMGMISEFDVVD